MEFAEIIQPGNILPCPPRHTSAYKGVSSWGEERIWGHRLWHRQTPWLLFLEFIGIAEGMLRDGRLFTMEDSYAHQSCPLHQRIALRNLLFNNSKLFLINESAKTDPVKWDEWITWMNEECEPNCGVDFAYLRPRFARFSDFARSIELLRQTAIEPNANRSWSSRFLFPFGANSLYEDLKISDGKKEHTANNFGRAGELLYLMVSRSRLATELRVQFSDLLKKSNIPDKMVVKLAPPSPKDDLWEGRTGRYLPYRQHPTYDRVAEDWMAILRLNLPGKDAYAHIVPLGAFHLLLYEMETAAAWAGRVSPPSYVCEVIAPKMEFVRQVAIRSFLDNDGLPRIALEALVNKEMTGPEWEATVNNPTLLTDAERVAEAKQHLSERLWLERKVLPTCADLAEVKSAVMQRLHEKLDGNVGLLHASYGRDCGLVSKRGTRSYRYAPTDTFLKSLVLANVQRRMEIGDFLALIFKRYRLIFGPVEGAAALSRHDFEETPFQRNLDRLEERFRSMGLLNRLSDGVAYVENPFVN